MDALNITIAFTQTNHLCSQNLGMYSLIITINIFKRNHDLFSFSIILHILFYRRYLGFEFSHKMKEDITENDVKYSIESDIPQQENSYDCGIFVCEYAEKITRNASITIKKEGQLENT